MKQFKLPSLLGTHGALDSAPSWFQRYKLTWIAGPAFFFLIALTLGSIWQLSTASVQKVRAFRTELFQRDLQDISARLDADERAVLNANVVQLIPERRSLQPLLLPRQYFIGLPPAWSKTIPRSPPRNCFIQLVVSDTPEKGARICSYVTENRSAGNFLFLNLNFEDSAIAPLRVGDVKLQADGARIDVKIGDRVISWWLFLQSPRDTNRNRFEIAAFRLRNSVVERDKKVEGWAHINKLKEGTSAVNVVARIDMRELGDVEDSWPPPGWRDMRLSVSRRNTDADYSRVRDYRYADVGPAQLSLSSLAAPVFAAHGSLAVSHPAETGGQLIEVSPPEELKAAADVPGRGFRLEDGDLIVRSHPLEILFNVPDTEVVVRAYHPGTVIQKEVWVTLILLGLLLIGGVVATVYFFGALLWPMGRLSVAAEQAVTEPDGDVPQLPYLKQKGEIGVLARAFNDLIWETRRRAARDARAREENLKIIGHEILSPLQALMNGIDESHRARHFVDRMVNAVTALFGTSGSAGFQSRQMHMHDVDLATYLKSAAGQQWGGTVDNVRYVGPDDGVSCRVDPDALEDALTNVLNNAQKFRADETTVVVSLAVQGDSAVITVANQGEPISDEVIAQAFEWKFTTPRPGAPTSQGIGLWGARSYVENMGGSIVLQRVDGGAEVRISLPVIRKFQTRIGQS